MSTTSYKAKTVREAAEGNWLYILSALAPQIEPALKKAGRHVSCPIHGGKDGFRLFKDAPLTGGGVCNTCGKFHDGFKLLMQLNGWGFRDCLTEVAEYLGVEKEENERFKSERNSAKAPAKQEAKSDTPRIAGSEKLPQPVKGILLEHSKAPYMHNAGNVESYYVSVREASGKAKTVWGVDLERAVSNATPPVSIGDNVVLTCHGTKYVTVKTEVKDDTGAATEKSIQVVRKEWSIEQSGASSKGEVESVPSLGDRSVTKAVECTSETIPEEIPETERKNVVPMFREQPKPWLLELQEDMQKRMEREKVYSARLHEKIENLWAECVPYSNPLSEPMRLYFKSRELLFRTDLVEETDCLRFHPEMVYYDEDGNEVGKFPTIVCAIRDVEGNIVTLHRTYLTPAGKKAKVDSPKKMMPIPGGLNVNGAAVRLGKPADGILGLAEGLETALSAYRVTGIPVWSTVNATLLESFEIPDGVHTVLIWADKDKSYTGERSAQVLKTRLEKRGIHAIILSPRAPIPAKAKSMDWNDILMTQGRFGFPSGIVLRAAIDNRPKSVSV